ncbi:PTS transporter subunit EIIB, partial [Klebsiella pneumoniae]|uniref:PTS transporter subunit EIIB n=1 Tax=Klebsiella pneumoniae TaxID=573 RepID=UPI00200BFD29
MAKITKEMIARILAHVGGAANVAQAGNCMTRLRLTLRDESLADSAAIRQIDGVMEVIVSDEQFQVVLGPGKAQTAAEMMNGLLEAAPAAAPPRGGRGAGGGNRWVKWWGLGPPAPARGRGGSGAR